MNKEIFADYFEIIESSELFAKLALSNNEETFLRSIRSVDDVLLFKDEISADLDLAGHVTSRIDALIDFEADREALHPYDHAIAAYLYILSESNINEFLRAWEKVKEKRLSNLWWAYGVGSYIYKGAIQTPIATTDKNYDVDLRDEFNLTDEIETSIKKGSATEDEGRYRDPGGPYA